MEKVKVKVNFEKKENSETDLVDFLNERKHFNSVFSVNLYNGNKNFMVGTFSSAEIAVDYAVNLRNVLRGDLNPEWAESRNDLVIVLEIKGFKEDEGDENESYSFSPEGDVWFFVGTEKDSEGDYHGYLGEVILGSLTR